MKTKIIAVPLEEGSGMKGSAEIIKFFKKHNINIDIEVIFNRGKNDRETVYNCCKETKRVVLDCLKDKHFPLVIGGDHALSIGSISAVIQKCDISIIWFDAHPDINTPSSSISKRIHGMPLATLMKNGYPELSMFAQDKEIKKEDIIYIGVRNFDPYEKQYISENNIALYTDSYIQNHSLEQIFDRMKKIIIKPVHISFDLDVINPNFCPGVNTPVVNGLSLMQAKRIIDFLFNSYNVVSMDLVEYNPLKDNNDVTIKIIKEIIETVIEKVRCY
ncbi:MAG: arginase [Erysipelotrichaceae bacterium]